MTIQTTHNIPVRIMDFQFDQETVRKSLPVFFPLLGLSMTLPFLEPYLIRSMKTALEKTTNKNVAEEVKQFIGQEAQHFKQHKKVNDLIKACFPGENGLTKIEAQMEADYQRFSKTKSLKFNLAYAEGFEAATCAFARTEMQYQEFEKIVEIQGTELSRLFYWHLTEEVEHRCVTFNIYQHLYGDYFYRLFVGCYGQYHFFKYVFRFSNYMQKHITEPARPARMSARAASTLLLNILKSYLPTYNPARIKLHKNFNSFTQRFSSEAVEVRGAE